MKKILYLFIALTTYSLSTNAQIQAPSSRDKMYMDVLDYDGPSHVNFEKTTVVEYLQKLKKADLQENSSIGNLLSLTNFASSNWIQKEELTYLMELIDSEEPARCVFTTFASTLPLKETATIGGHAMDLIDSYRLKKKYPFFLTSCPKADEDRRNEIKNWWKTYITTKS